jgi:hypothetical protein
MPRPHSLRRVFHAVIVSGLLMLLGENVPSAKEKRIRGDHPFMSDEHLAVFEMYDDTAAKAYGELKEWLNERNDPPLFAQSGEGTKLCVGIITARRVNSMVLYLRQMMTALLVRTYIPNPEIYMHIYNVDEKPEKHTEIDFFRKWFNVTNIKSPKPDFGADRFTSQIQESLDYSIIMRDLLAKGCRNSLLLEDDALPNQHWLEETLDAIEFLDNRKNTEWFVVRLFVARWRGFYPKPPPRITSYDQGFNTVAILMNGAHMKRFADEMDTAVFNYLKGSGPFFEAKDIFMGQFKRSSGLPIESLEPGPFQHTGLSSSRGARNIRSFNWYMGSKNFQAENIPIEFDPKKWGIV